MDKIYSNIESMKKIIDDYIPYMLFSGNIESGKHMAVLSKGLSEIMPQIITVYDDERMTPFFEDRNYWILQLERILNAIESGDAFMAYDTLVNEFQENLTQLQAILLQTGVVS